MAYYSFNVYKAHKRQFTPSSKQPRKVCFGTMAARALTHCTPALLTAPPPGLCRSCQTCCSRRSSIPRQPPLSFLSPCTPLPTQHLHTKALPVYCLPHVKQTGNTFRSCHSFPDPVLFLFVATVTIQHILYFTSINLHSISPSRM